MAGLLRALRAVAPNVTGEDFCAIVMTYVVTTALLWVIAYGAATVFPENKIPVGHYTRFKALDVWIRWDGGHFASIAKSGYQNMSPGNTTAPWFPLYPGLIALLVPAPDYRYVMAPVVSHLCFFLVLLVLFDVVAPWLGKGVARRAVLYISIFPSAMFFRAAYAEALFTLVILLSYQGYVRGRYWQCALFGALAAMTRVPGVLLFPAFAATALWEIALKKKRFRPAMLLIGLIPVGLGAVLWIHWRQLGDPLAYLHTVTHPAIYGRRLVIPGASLFDDLKWMLYRWDFIRGDIMPQLLFDDIAMLMGFAGALYFFRRYGFLAGTLSLLLLLASLMAGRTIGMIRYVLPIFFYVVFLAEMGEKHPWFHSLWVCVSSLFLAFYTMSFACWYWAA